eukprot:SAG31_NODE_171_length_21415_cov_7.512807_5_plen_106_part_00
MDCHSYSFFFFLFYKNDHALDELFIAVREPSPVSPPLEVREGRRGALRPRQLASGLALVVVRHPRAPRVRVVCARLVPLTLCVELVAPSRRLLLDSTWNIDMVSA